MKLWANHLNLEGDFHTFVVHFIRQVSTFILSSTDIINGASLLFQQDRLLYFV